MKYWKGKQGTPKEGHFGTMDDTNFVPDANECTTQEYNNWVSNQPIIPTPVRKLKLKNSKGHIEEYEIVD